MQAAAKHMKNGGRLITIGSCLGERVAGPGITIYSMTKGAVANLARGLARDLGPRGITVNVVEPGPIDTDMNPADAEGAADQARSTALGRYGKPEDIADMVAHLAGESGRYITGASFLVDGGYAQRTLAQRDDSPLPCWHSNSPSTAELAHANLRGFALVLVISSRV